MSWETYDDDCPGCKPAILDIETGAKLPDEHPIMQVVLREWKKLTQDEKETFHRVCCNNSHDPEDLAIFSLIGQRFSKAVNASENNNDA